MRALVVRVALLVAGALAVTALHAAALVVARPGEKAVAAATPAHLSRPTARAGEATLLFGGDTAIVDAGLRAVGEESWDWPLEGLRPLLAEADLAVVNHEAPITNGVHPYPLWKEWRYRAPVASAGALARAGVHVLDLANNHALDDGAEGLADTLDAARDAGLATVGAGLDLVAARRGLVVELGGVRVGLVAYCEDQLLWRLWTDQPARPRHPGVAALDEAALAADLTRLHAQADLVIVLLHAGETYAPPQARVVAWARRAVALGADAVIGHHPHVPHPVLLVDGRPVLLSLGNFAFGTRGHPSLESGLGALLRVRDRRLVQVELVPLDVQNARVRYRPVALTGDAARAALGRLAEDGRAFADAARVRIEGDRGIVELEAPRR